MVIFVNDQEYTTEDLCITLPVEFEKHNFKDMHEVSMAYMYSKSAEECKAYGRADRTIANQSALKNILAS